MASKWMPVTDVEEAWRLRQAGLLHLSTMPPLGPVTSYLGKELQAMLFNKDKYVVLVDDDDDEDNNEEQ